MDSQLTARRRRLETLAAFRAGCSRSEIAKRQRISYGNVCKRLDRALKDERLAVEGAHYSQPSGPEDVWYETLLIDGKTVQAQLDMGWNPTQGHPAEVEII